MEFDDFLAILIYIFIAISAAVGMGLVFIFLKKLRKIESKDKLEEEKLND